MSPEILKQNIDTPKIDLDADYLEDDLVDSSFMNDIVGKFEKINELYQEYDTIAAVYDELLSVIKDENSIYALCIFAIISRPQHRKTAMLQNKTAGCIGSDSYLSCISSSVKVKMSFGVQDKIRQSFSIVDAVIFWLFRSCCIVR